MSSSRTIRTVAPLLLLVHAACDGSGPAPDRPSEPPAPAAPAPAGVIRSDPARTADPVWFETLIQHPAVPKMPVVLAPLPDGRSFFILGRNGDLYHYAWALESFAHRGPRDAMPRFKPAGPVTKVRIDDVYGSGDMGSIGMALDPGFDANGFLYVWSTDKKDTSVGLDRFTWGPDPAAVEKSRTRIIRFSRREPPAPYHMGGIVAFLPDGSLLLAPGDAERPELAQDRKDLNGKILRIVPGRGPEGGYTVPADNPHAGDAEWSPEIAATGVRAAFRGYLHQGRHFVFGDVGATHEEIDVWSGGAADFGWGRGLNTDGPDVPAGAVPPILSYTPRSDWTSDDAAYSGESRVSIGVGLVYDPGERDRYAGRLSGKLVFFEIMRGWVRAGSLTEDRRLPAHEHIGHRQFIAHMVQGADGYVYGLCWEGPPSLWRLRPRDAAVADRPEARR